MIKTKPLVAALAALALTIGATTVGAEATASASSPRTDYKADVTLIMGTSLHWTSCGPKNADTCASRGELSFVVTSYGLAMAMYKGKLLGTSQADGYLEDICWVTDLVAGDQAESWVKNQTPKMGQSISQNFGSWLVAQRLLTADHTTYEVGMTFVG
jgi:hypothetical protein